MTFDRLRAAIAEAMERLRVPGVGIGVLHEGRAEAAGLGVTSIAHPLPVDAETLFQIGSISKTITATAAAVLEERGLLDLGAPVRRYLPDLRLADESVAARVTMRHLLTHTAGFEGDRMEDAGRGDDALARRIAQLAEAPQLAPLDELWSYNNAAFHLAGRVIEVVAGQPFQAAVRRLVFEPIGMRAFYSPEDVIVDRFAVGHRLVDGRLEVARPWALPRGRHPSGGVIASASSLLTYARFHLEGGKPGVLSAESVARMQVPIADAGSNGQLGLGWFLRDVGGLRTVGHGGATVGQMASLLLVPERGFAVGVVTNADRGAELHREATEWALREYLGAVEPEPSLVQLPAERLREYAGRYVAELADLELTVDGDELLMQMHPKGGFPSRDTPAPPAPPPVRLAFTTDDRVICLDAPFAKDRGDFLRAPDGRLAWFRWGVRAHRRQD
jgi:CubicO group peptidase (beta-lactamase class C family)